MIKSLDEKPIKITDTTFRDAHQSLMATRLRTTDMEPIAAEMDAVGFHSMEVWGGATFDVATRFLGEDPWERLRMFRRLMPKTSLMMLLRGQSLVGYRAYADDVVDAFVEQAAHDGIDIFRVFDALNDERNVERAAEAIKKNGKHLQLAVCYSVTEEGRLGGAIYDLDYFVEKAKCFQDMGADSICVKDMGGVLAPYDAHKLITTLKSTLEVPLQLHTHYTSGMASMTILKAIEAGVDLVDTCLAPLALRTSQPAIEPLAVALGGTARDCGLDMAKLLQLGDYLESILDRYQEHMKSPKAAVIDARVLSHQIPGGMASNLISQLREADALDKLDEVLAEIPLVRKELGYPPLVTPMSQMVGSQSVTNVLFGRYKMVSHQVKDYIYGLYGKSPAPVDAKVAQIALKDYDRGGQSVSGRPADYLNPELAAAHQAMEGISEDREDILTYALYPTTGMRFLRIKHGLDPVPEDMKPQILSDTEATSADPERPRPLNLPEAPQRSPRARRFNVFVGEDEYFQVDVDPVSGPIIVGPGDNVVGGDKSVSTTPRTGAKSTATEEAELVAPIPGIVLRYMVEVGQIVQAGDPVVILEAMKMENTLPSPVAGTIKALASGQGRTVSKDTVLAVITVS